MYANTHVYAYTHNKHTYNTHKPHVCVHLHTHTDINKLKTDKSDCGVQEPCDIDQDTKPTNAQYRRY